MRIGIDATTIYTDHPTGLGVYSINVINELSRLNSDLVVWTVNDSMLQIEPENVRKVMQPFRFLGNRLFQLRPFWVQNVLPYLIRKEGIDILYTTIPNGLCGSPVPHVVTVHDIIPLVYPEDAPRTVRWNFRHRLPKIFDEASAIVSVSEYTRMDLLKHYRLDPAKIRVISEGYDKSNFVPKMDLTPLSCYGLKPEGYILYVGNSSPRKNIFRLIESYSLVSGRISHDLVLVGSKEPSQVRQLEEHAKRYGIVDRVKLLEYVPYRSLAALYGGAALFAFISEYEGFGLPVLEAMACGGAVLASDATSLPEVAGDAAILVDPYDTSAIAEKMLAVLTDDSLRDAMRQKALERCRMFDWQITAKDIYSLLRSCMSA